MCKPAKWVNIGAAAKNKSTQILIIEEFAFEIWIGGLLIPAAVLGSVVLQPLIRREVWDLAAELLSCICSVWTRLESFIKTEDGNRRREKKRWAEADVGKENSHARKPSQLQNKLHGKVKELLRQLHQGDRRLKDLGKVNDGRTEEIALKKTCEAACWVRAARLGRRSRRAERREPSKRKHFWREIG